uniref:Uncharacterized protein n=1 Tax=Oryza brachyantha TaxID=4533 RepID=J3MED2_ORYBR
MTHGGSSNVPEKRRKKRQDPVSTSTKSDGDNSPPVQYPRGRVGKKKVDEVGKNKVDEVSPSRRRGKKLAHRGCQSGGIHIEEPSSSPPPIGSARGPCDAQRPNHEAVVGAIRLFTKPVLTAAFGHETPRKAVDYLKNMARARTDRGRAPEQQLENRLSVLLTKHNWSEKLIGQFYASAHFEDSDDGSEEKVRWLSEGIEYSITISQFASVLGLDDSDLSKLDLHLQPALSQETLRRLYVDDSSKVRLGTVNGLLPHFDLLLKMIKTTVSPKSGDKSALTARHAALLWSMRASASPSNMMKYIWNKIQAIVLDPSKGLAYAPFLHIMIRRVTGFYFEGECVHYPYRPQIPQAPKVAGSKGCPVGSSSQPPRASSPSLPIKRALSAIFGIFKKNAVKIKSNERKINQILRNSGHEIPLESEDE